MRCSSHSRHLKQKNGGIKSCLFHTLGLNGPSQPPASNGIQAALLQQPQKQPQLASFKQQTRRNPPGNRLLEAAAVTGRHPRIVEV